MPASTTHEHKATSDRANPFASFPYMAWPSGKLMARTNEILSQTAKDVWAGELELMRL